MKLNDLESIKLIKEEIARLKKWDAALKECAEKEETRARIAGFERILEQMRAAQARGNQ